MDRVTFVAVAVECCTGRGCTAVVAAVVAFDEGGAGSSEA